MKQHIMISCCICPRHRVEEADGGILLCDHGVLREEVDQTADILKGLGTGVKVEEHGASRPLRLCDLQVEDFTLPSVNRKQELDEVNGS